MYSPIIPIKKSWTAEKKNRPITNGAVPREKPFQKRSFATKYPKATKRLMTDIPKPNIVASRRGILE